MEKSKLEVERFIHQIISPLTSLQSAIDLLSHHYGQSDDQRLVGLIAAMQRAILRIRQFSQQLTSRTHLEGLELVVRIPISLVQSEQSTAKVSAPATTIVETTGLAVLVGAAALDPIEQALVTAGWQVDRETTGAAGLDAARRLRPRLLIIAEEITDIDQIMCAQIARTDPETRNVLVVLARQHPASDIDIPHIDLRQPPFEQLQHILAVHQRRGE